MEEKKKWWQSRTVQAGIALIIASAAYLGISFGVVNIDQLESAQNTVPEVGNGITLIKGGQVFAGIGAIVGALVIYFRQKATALLH